MGLPPAGRQEIYPWWQMPKGASLPTPFRPMTFRPNFGDLSPPPSLLSCPSTGGSTDFLVWCHPRPLSATTIT